MWLRTGDSTTVLRSEATRFEASLFSPLCNLLPLPIRPLSNLSPKRREANAEGDRLLRFAPAHPIPTLAPSQGEGRMPIAEASTVSHKLAKNGSIASLPFVKAHWGMYRRF
ncbi:MAG: hypothetical protein NT023_23225 [Armatimonadetes bacterium]|nr:hypothetical protein [Armatimonadota bacterium]